MVCSVNLLFFHKHNKLKRRVEVKDRKIVEILKNHFGQFYKLKKDNSQLHTSYEV